MLELRTYTMEEMEEIFGIDNISNLQRTLDGYQIEYTKTGTGRNSLFEITAIKDELRLFCILDLGFNSRTDMLKLTNFLYYFLNVDDYVNMPEVAKETFMRDNNRYVSRQTIANYTNKLIAANYVARSSEYIYYFILKNNRQQTTRETYNKAWKEYFADKEYGLDSQTAIFNMIANYGGYARKYAPTEQNAIYANEINYLNTLVGERIEEIYGTQ